MEELTTVLKDFLNDILTTFPEYKDSLDSHLKKVLDDEVDEDTKTFLLDYFQSVYPERFFDILYQKAEIFSDNEVNTEFLPGIEFKTLWTENISDKTKRSYGNTYN